jgi:hypothetical protein
VTLIGRLHFRVIMRIQMTGIVDIPLVTDLSPKAKSLGLLDGSKHA